jgi:hypothetical protein
VRVDANFEALDLLAADVGLDVCEADHMLRVSLQRLKTLPNDAHAWGLLPEAYGMMIVSPAFQRSVYSVVNAGHTNNAHCTVECIKALSIHFAHLPLPTEKTNPDTVDILYSHRAY